MKRTLLCMLILLGCSVVADAATTWDAVSDSHSCFSATTCTTNAFTITSNANRVCVVSIRITNTNPAPSAGNVSCGGATSGALIDSVSDGSPSSTTYAFGVIAPGTGSGTASVSGLTSDTIGISAITFYNAAQSSQFTNAVHNASGFQGNASVSVTSANGDLTTSTRYNTNGTDPTTNQTQRLGGGATGWDAGPGTGTTTHTWTSSSGFTVAIGINIVQAGGGGGRAPTLLLLGVAEHHSARVVSPSSPFTQHHRDGPSPPEAARKGALTCLAGYGLISGRCRGQVWHR